MRPQKKVRLSLTPARITIFYYIFLGGLWILFSDLLLSSFAPTLAWLTLFQTFKGWFFVIVTGSLLYGLIKYYSYERTKAENDLRNSHGQLVSILDGINDGFITLDRDLKYTSVNRRAGILLNHTPEECIGKYFWDIFPDAQDHHVSKTMGDALQSLQPVEFECFHAPAQRWFEHRVYSSKDGLTIFFQDITQQKEAEAERQLLLAIIDKTSDIISLATPDGTITYLNRAGIELIGFYPAGGGTKKNITEIHPRWASDIIYSTGLPTAAVRGLWKGETVILDSNGREVPVSQLIMSHKTPDGTLTYFSSIIREITDMKLKEEALRESEEKFSKAFQASPNAMVITRASDNVIIDVNDSFIRASGYGYEEVVGKTTIDLNLWREQSDRKTFLAQLTREGSVTKHIFYFQHKSGNIRCGSISGETIHIGTDKCYLSVIEDITDQKKIEEELRMSRDQLRNYGARLQHIREEERTYIAREIHDELGQILTGLKMDLSFLEEILLEEARLTQRREVRAKIDSMSNLMDSAIGSMRKIITELRPVVLDTMGLSAAIEWQADEFQQRTGIACFYTSPQDMPTLPRDFATSIFRILQESLTNIIRHAGASRTTITMKLDQGNLILLVHDDGRGISEDEIAQKKSFGITGMKERVELLGGKFNIHGIQGKGTLLSVEIPLPSQQAQTTGENGNSPGN